MKIDIKRDSLVTKIRNNGVFDPTMPTITSKTNWGNYFVIWPMIVTDYDTRKKFWVCFEIIQRRRVTWKLDKYARWSSSYYEYKVNKNGDVK